MGGLMTRGGAFAVALWLAPACGALSGADADAGAGGGTPSGRVEGDAAVADAAAADTGFDGVGSGDSAAETATSVATKPDSTDDSGPSCDCPSHQQCDAGGACVPKVCNTAAECNESGASSAEPFYCPDGKCRAWQCANDAQCGAGRKCNSLNYKCYDAPKGCTLDTHCLDDDVCSDDSCDKATGACTHSKLQGCCNSAADCDDKNPCTTESCGGSVCAWKDIAACCSQDADCTDSDACTADSCLKSGGPAGKCKHLAAAGCCTKANQCDDGEPATSDSCDAASKACVHGLPGAPVSCKANGDCVAGCAAGTCAGGTCSYAPTVGAGCCQQSATCPLGGQCMAPVCSAWQCQTAKVSGAVGPHLSYDFEQGLDGWTTENGNATAIFHHSKGWAAHGQGALRYGVPGKESIEGGFPNSGAATSPSFVVPKGAKVRALVFFDGEPGAGVHLFELLAVLGPGNTQLLWSKNGNLKGNTGGAWKDLAADLSSLAGKTISLRWRFDVAVNFPQELGKGLFLDAVVVEAPCP